jgi:myo-inositol-1(or 4)-monophosphatase
VGDDLELAGQLVRSAGRLAAEMRREGVTTSRKTSVSDVVTAADHAAEEMLVARLLVERPEDGIVGEEGASVTGRRTWFLDPIDGTYNYASGLPTWCSAAALTDGTDLLVGAIYHPAEDELWLGGVGQPATANGRPLEPLPDRPLSEVSVASYLHPGSLHDEDVREPLLQVMRAAATVRMLGSGSVELAAVAAGRIGAYVQTDCLDWDWLPGRALVEAAGGATAVREHRGHRWHVAGNRQTVAEMIERLLA